MKEKVLNLINNNKRIAVAILVLLIIVSIFGVVKVTQYYIGKNTEAKEAKKKEEDLKAKEELEGLLQEMGKSWYEDFYYPQMKKNISKWKDTGVSSSLENFNVIKLEGFEEKIKKFENRECNFEKTKAIVKPYDPFGPQDYKIDFVLECGFSDYE